MNNVISHPAFEREPVINERRRGRPAGTISFSSYRRNKADERISEWAARVSQERAETDAERADRLESTIDKIAHQFVWLLREARDPNLGDYLGNHISQIVGFIIESREARHE
jgi:hypothetical protein